MKRMGCYSHHEIKSNPMVQVVCSTQDAQIGRPITLFRGVSGMIPTVGVHRAQKQDSQEGRCAWSEAVKAFRSSYALDGTPLSFNLWCLWKGTVGVHRELAEDRASALAEEMRSAHGGRRGLFEVPFERS